MYIQPFAMGEDWPEIERLMEVSTTAFLLSVADIPL